MTKLYGTITHNEYYDDRREIERHKKMQQASIYVYHPDTAKPPEGYELVGYPIIDKETGFQACVFKNGNDIIIAFAGTNDYFNDLDDDVLIWAGKESEQIRQAKDLSEEIEALYPEAVISYTGHSLGGGLAGYMSAITHREGVTFNALGARSLIKKGDRIDTSRIVNYCNPRDKIASLNPVKHLGRLYSIESKPFTSDKKTAWWAHHDIEVMEDLITREEVSAEELSQRYWNYERNKNSEEMDEIDYYIRYGRRKPIRMRGLGFYSEKTPCAGTYPVSGYTREDGTQVKGYTRTCGAKHSGWQGKRFDEMSDAEIDYWLDELI